MFRFFGDTQMYHPSPGCGRRFRVRLTPPRRLSCWPAWSGETVASLGDLNDLVKGWRCPSFWWMIHDDPIAIAIHVNVCFIQANWLIGSCWTVGSYYNHIGSNLSNLNWFTVIHHVIHHVLRQFHQTMLQPPGAALRRMLMAKLVVHKAPLAQAKSPSSHRSFATSKRILLIACRMSFTSSIQNTVIIMLHAQILELKWIEQQYCQ